MGIEKRLFHAEALPAAGERLVLRLMVILLVSSVVNGAGIGLAEAASRGPDAVPAGIILDCIPIPGTPYCIEPGCLPRCSDLGVEVA